MGLAPPNAATPCPKDASEDLANAVENWAWRNVQEGTAKNPIDCENCAREILKEFVKRKPRGRKSTSKPEEQIVKGTGSDTPAGADPCRTIERRAPSLELGANHRRTAKGHTTVRPKSQKTTSPSHLIRGDSPDIDLRKEALHLYYSDNPTPGRRANRVPPTSPRLNAPKGDEGNTVPAPTHMGQQHEVFMMTDSEPGSAAFYDSPITDPERDIVDPDYDLHAPW